MPNKLFSSLRKKQEWMLGRQQSVCHRNPSLQVRCGMGKRTVYPNHGDVPLSIFSQGTQSPFVKDMLQTSCIPQNTGIFAKGHFCWVSSFLKDLLTFAFWLAPSLPSFLPSFLPQILLEFLICIRQCPRHLGTQADVTSSSVEQDAKCGQWMLDQNHGFPVSITCLEAAKRGTCSCSLWRVKISGKCVWTVCSPFESLLWEGRHRLCLSLTDWNHPQPSICWLHTRVWEACFPCDRWLDKLSHLIPAVAQGVPCSSSHQVGLLMVMDARSRQ